ncbi:hypothetical protein BD626DRAFT_11831 [Schizophyllum amplum]|uniref:Uncharacterized protein n=1 Tax=Schizophyllum amplum TaxID=97359 RepID=A0A550CX90_9AGAR|nr:hypothetical protein BD626DRAFT_11831 [Auriculariopsis ampla]
MILPGAVSSTALLSQMLFNYLALAHIARLLHSPADRATNPSYWRRRRAVIHPFPRTHYRALSISSTPSLVIGQVA